MKRAERPLGSERAVRPTWAVIPAKSLERGKSRLSAVLGSDERVRFARDLLEHVLGAARASSIDEVLVATDGDDVAELATARGARVSRDVRGEPLAALVDRALAGVAAEGALAAVVLMADLPLLEVVDIEAMIEAMAHHEVVLVPDHLGHHTNALALSPPTAIPTCFGRAESFAEHRAAAHAAGLRVCVLENNRIAFDVDGPADHLALTGRRSRVEI